MEWFSTEIAIKKKKNGERVFIVIDYVNDQCDMTVKSKAHNGVPDDIVEHTARRIVGVAWRHIRGYPLPTHSSIWLV